MQKIRTTFKRSRTPTGSEIKTQNSLEVPKQVRSASFDEMQLETKRGQETPKPPEEKYLLQVPSQTNNQRSRSVDAAASSSDDTSDLNLEMARQYLRRRSSGERAPIACIHCQYTEDIARFHETIKFDDESENLSDSLESLSSLLGSSDSLSSVEELEETEGEKPEDAVVQTCSITITPSPNPPEDEETCSGETQVQGRRRSLTSPRLSRQSAFVLDKNTSLDDGGDASSGKRRAASQPGITIRTENVDYKGRPTLQFTGGIKFDLKIDAPEEDAIKESKMEDSEGGVQQSSDVKDIFLQVPDLKRDRAASVDSCFTKVSQTGKPEEAVRTLEPPTNVNIRSRSVDIVLPTDEQERYKALTMAHANWALQRRISVANEPHGERSLRCTPDWSESALNGDHLWYPTSGDFCYVESGCTKNGPRMKCSACKVTAHTSCIPILMDDIKFLCKSTFRDVGIRQYREHTMVCHHWVHRRNQKGKCADCAKSFPSKLSFTSKDIVGLNCSWCKCAYHNREDCFSMIRLGEECTLGEHREVIVPPSWIVKLPRSGTFRSSLRGKSTRKKSTIKKKPKEKADRVSRVFAIKAIPSPFVKPVIVFINPKSGGNQGMKLMQKFQCLLNPRQVFDLSEGGPRVGLELYKKVINLRILACGGDGTVGWVLSVLDQMEIYPPPPVAVLPLGTGNDLARALGWGGGYTDQPVGKIMTDIALSEVVLLDRWELKVARNTEVELLGDGKDNLPLNVVNNYFSLGVDAHIALEFHEAREAHPERFNSRLKNKMFYGQMGGKDLLKRKWKDLSEFVRLECDGKDLTPKLKEHKVHAIVFLNIPSYGGGTRPWNRSSGAVEPATDDGIIEVIGLTTYQLPLLQAGGHGTNLTQCKTAKLVTTKTIPMQVDGEACRLLPSVIHLSLLNKAPMLVKRKGKKSPLPQAALEQVKVSVQKIGMADYEQYHYDKDLLAQSATEIGMLELSPGTDLEQVRHFINRLFEECTGTKLSPDWCFIDSCTAERFFRVDRAQEHLHYLADITNDILYILDPEGSVTTSDDDAQGAACAAGATALDFSDDERMTKSRKNESPKVKSRVPVISTPMDDEKKTQGEVICRSRSAEGISPRRKQEERGHKPSQKTGIAKSPSAETGISNLLERSSEKIIRAARNGDIRYLKELHSQGHSLLSIDAAGQTALHHAARNGHRDIVRYVLANAPATIVNMQENDRGRTALHIAAENKQRSICCMLVASGASVTMKDYDGLTPKHISVQAEDAELAGYFESQERFQLVPEDAETVV